MSEYLVSRVSRFVKPLSLVRVSSTASQRAFGDPIIKVCGKEYRRDVTSNVTRTILERTERNIHRTPQHPVAIVKDRIVHHFNENHVNRVGNAAYTHIDDTPPVVTTEQNFDSLFIPPGHASRQRHDNYYINSTHMLRAHTSAHQRDFIKMGLNKFLVTGDVYRRDEIDSNHYPVFHQMEGVALFTKEELFRSSDDESLEILERQPNEMIETSDKQAKHTIDGAKMMELNLKKTLENLVRDLFGGDTETRWGSCYFPFTHPSYELEVKFKGNWLEVLGSGVMKQEILEHAGAGGKIGWAFGLGLDRLAMLLFDIPDIRMLWSTNERFVHQFRNVGLDPATDIVFQKYSLLPPIVRDITFWIDETFNEKDFYDTVRDVCGDIIEKAELIDTFVHPTLGRTSRCYRLVYCCTEDINTSKEVNKLQETLNTELVARHNVEIRG